MSSNSPNLDKAVIKAYGFNSKKDILEQLLDLNYLVAEKEEDGQQIIGPGLPIFIKDRGIYITDDCIKFTS